MLSNKTKYRVHFTLFPRTTMFSYKKQDRVYLTLLPCTMENEVFVTNIKWDIHGLRHSWLKVRYFESKDVILRDPIKNETTEIRVCLTKEPGSEGNTYQIDYKQDNQWKLNSSVVDFESIESDLEHTVHLPINFYYVSKTLMDDLRQYLALIHGDENRLIRRCPNKTLLDIVDKEYNEDFVIECDGQEFKIKKIFLQARSPVFERMLSTNEEGRENRMNIADFDAEIVEKMIEFFKTDIVNDWSNFEIKLYEISQKYMCQSFMEYTRRLFVHTLTNENYRERAEIVRKHDDTETKKLIKKWNSENYLRR